MAQAKKITEHKSQDKMQNMLALVVYVVSIVTIIGPIVSLIVLLAEKKNSFIRFHAAQAFIFFGGMFVISMGLSYIPMMSHFLSGFLNIFRLFIWVILIVKSYQGVRYKLPYIGDLADSLLKKVG